MPDRLKVKSSRDLYQYEMVRKLILKFLLQQRNSSDQERFFSRLHSADGPRKRSDTVLKTVILGTYGKNQEMFENDTDLMSRFKDCYQEIQSLILEDTVAQNLQSGDDQPDSSSQPSESSTSNDSINSINSTYGVPDAESTRTIGYVDPPQEINSVSFIEAVSRHSPQKKSLKRTRDDENDGVVPAKHSRTENLPKPIFKPNQPSTELGPNQSSTEPELGNKYHFGQSILTLSKNDTPIDDRTIDRTDG